MNFNNISSWSIRNPIPIVLMFVVLTIAGLVSYTKLRTNQFPDVDLPVVAGFTLDGNLGARFTRGQGLSEVADDQQTAVAGRHFRQALGVFRQLIAAGRE